MLGLEPIGDHLIVDPALPEGIGHVELLDIPGRWGRIDAFGRERAPIEDGGRAAPMTETLATAAPQPAERVNAAAASADGRTIAFEAPLGTPLEPGGFAVVATEPPLLAQVTECAIARARRSTGGARTSSKARRPRSAAGTGGFGDRADRAGAARGRSRRGRTSASAPTGSTSARSSHAPGVRARLDARGLARHTFLCGQSGSGKTYTTGVLLEQIVRGRRASG